MNMEELLKTYKESIGTQFREWQEETDRQLIVMIYQKLLLKDWHTDFMSKNPKYSYDITRLVRNDPIFDSRQEGDKVVFSQTSDVKVDIDRKRRFRKPTKKHKDIVVALKAHCLFQHPEWSRP